ncbi:hypothetical protein Tco_1359760 [Tanacetum coccineum]
MLGRKRAGKEQKQEFSKKQRIEEDKESDEAKEVSEDDDGELMKHLMIKKDEDIAIDAIPLMPLKTTHKKANERFKCILPEYDEEFLIKKLEDSKAEHQV